MISRAWYIKCDSCGAPAEIAVFSSKEAREFAEQQGFIYADKKDICPICARKSEESEI